MNLRKTNPAPYAAIAICVMMALFLTMDLIFWRDQQIAQKERQVVINPQPGKVIHVEISESAVVTTIFPVIFKPEPMAVVSDPVSVYAAPSTDSAVIGVLRTGEMRRILQQSEGQAFLQICCVQGQMAWVESAKVRVNGDTSALPVFVPLKGAPK